MAQMNRLANVACRHARIHGVTSDAWLDAHAAWCHAWHRWALLLEEIERG